MRLAVEMLREPAFPEAEFDQVKKQRLAAHREQPDASRPRSRRSRSHRATEPVPARRRPVRGHHRRADRRHHKRDAGRRAEVPRAVLRRSHGELVVVGQFHDPAVRSRGGGAPRRLDEPRRRTRRSPRPIRRVPPVNLKIETPDKQNATFRRGARVRDVRRRSRLPGDGAGQLHVRRVDHRPRAEPDPQPGRPQLRRELAVSAPASGNAASFGGTAIANPQNTPKVEASFRDELAKTLDSGFTADEVAPRRKRCAISGWSGARRTPRLLNLIAAREEFGRTLAWDEQMDAKLEALTAGPGQRRVPPPREPRSALDRQGRRLQGRRRVRAVVRQLHRRRRLALAAPVLAEPVEDGVVVFQSRAPTATSMPANVCRSMARPCCSTKPGL